MNIVNESLNIKVSDIALFDDRQNIANCSRIFYAYFEAIPSSKIIYGINFESALKWIESNLSDKIVQKHSRELCNYTEKNMKYTVINYVMKEGIVIKIEDHGDVMILYKGETENKADEIANEMKMLKRMKQKSNLNILVNEGTGLRLVDIKSKKPRLFISQNYNDDLLCLHYEIIRNLKKKDNSGLYLFHGIPGTGKSTYLRYILHYINKRVIFFPPKIAGNLDSPEFIRVLVNEPNSILIIEDAEDLLISREKGNTSGISMLLNLTDGLLGSGLGIQVICTFNSSILNIDKALLRKGRLKAMYEFKSLSISKSKVMFEKLGITNQNIKEPMTLADIYNTHEKLFEYKAKTHNPIGFAAMT